MKNLIISFLIIFTVISCSSTPSNKVSATDLTDEQIAKYNEGKEEDNQIVCRNEKPLGSNIAERVCYTVGQLKAREEADKENFRRDNNIFDRNPGG